MKIVLSAALALVISSTMSSAQEEGNPTDLSRYEIFKAGETIMSLAELRTMEASYQKLVEEKKCSEAIPVIIEFYEAANHVSNLIRRGNEPYYDARRDDQEVVARDRKLLAELISAEETFNNLLRKRNRAWVEEAKCLLNEGEKQAAVTRLYRALDYISSDERQLWEEARTLLWAEVGFTADK